MNFGSWSYDGTALDIQLSSDFVYTEDYVENSEWEYINSTATRDVKTYECCPEPYPYVTYNITLRRRGKLVKNNVETEGGHQESLHEVTSSSNSTNNTNQKSKKGGTKTEKMKGKKIKLQRKVAALSDASGIEGQGK